jgi:hypothetical protein
MRVMPLLSLLFAIGCAQPTAPSNPSLSLGSDETATLTATCAAPTDRAQTCKFVLTLTPATKVFDQVVWTFGNGHGKISKTSLAEQYRYEILYATDADGNLIQPLQVMPRTYEVSANAWFPDGSVAGNSVSVTIPTP